MTHLGLGFSNELPLGDPWGVLALLDCLLAWEAWGESSASSLGVSAVCLGRSTGCLGISDHCPGPTCLRWNSTNSLRVSAVHLRTTFWGEEVLAA